MASTKEAKLPRHSKPAEPPVAMSVKLERAIYVRLATFAAMSHPLRHHQEIMQTALIEYLDKHSK